jgi:hypothetical protein
VETGSQSYRKVVVVVLHTFRLDMGFFYRSPQTGGKSFSGILSVLLGHAFE